tara:strand:- start:3863 stop:6016 length:2154 start_codon:yes stop_codon:yes gene_type:complete
MQKLQLYISGERIDLFKDEQVSISLSQQDYKDPSKIFAEFTKTFSIPASKENNIIFKHYYNFNIVNGFDARNKIEASIQLNDIPFKEGFVALNGVDLKNNKPYAYRITFYGKTINLTKVFREDNLAVLTGELPAAIDYDDTTVIAKMQVAVPSSDIIVPLITHTTQAYYDSSQTNTTANLRPSGTNGLFFKELKFAIKVKTIVDAIESYYGTNFNLPAFSDDFFNMSDTDNPAFNNLYLWLHRKKGNVVPTTETTTYSTQVGSNGTGFLFTSSGQPTNTQMGSGTTLSIIPGFDNLDKNTLSIFPTTADNTKLYTVEIIETNSGQLFSSGEVSGAQAFNQLDFVLVVGSYYINIVSAVAVEFTNIEWEIRERVYVGGGGWTNTWESGTFNHTTTFQFVVGAQIPDIKVIDFMNGLFSMFNLTAFYDNQTLLVNGNTNPSYGKIKIQTLDSFYSTNFNTWDISKYISVDRSQVNVGLPYNQIAFAYQGVNTYYAAQFTQLQNDSWGALKYQGAGEAQSSSFTAPNKPYVVSVPFEHPQYVRLDDQNLGSQLNIQTGWFVDDNRESYIGNPLLFYPVLLTTSAPAATSIAIRNNESGSTTTTLTSYIIPSNSRTLSTTGTGGSTENINFKNENNEWNINGTEQGLFSGTLFANYYNTYISEVFNSSRRVINVTVFLPLSIVYKLQMNDVMTINNQDYIINTANINLISGKATLELLNKI